jgi:hypothetical protein
MRKAFVWLSLSAMLLALSVSGNAQQPKKVPVFYQLSATN